MPTGPKGEKRPADVIGNAVKIARIATGGGRGYSTPEECQQGWEDRWRGEGQRTDPGTAFRDRAGGRRGPLEEI